MEKFRLTTAIAIRTLALLELSFAAGKKGDEHKAFMSSCLKKAEWSCGSADGCFNLIFDES